jgi:hypothetical protein
MRTLILALAVVLLAAPAWATVEIIVTDTDGTGPGKIAEISYDATGETELVRAFALNITVDTGTIDDINDYAIGDDNGGYGIFPGNFAANITVNPTTGNVDNWGVAGYTPVAPAGDPDALPGLGTSGVTIEMGALYDTLAPGTTGVLCTLVCSDNCLMTVTGNAIRGNVVLETAAEAGVDFTQATDIPIGGLDECFPDTNPDYADWVEYGKPLCWCNSANGGTGDYQCDGDADGGTEGILKYRVALNDLNMIIANWKKRMSASPDPCADIDHKSEGILKYRVALNDLNIIIANWKKRDSALAGDCPR